MRRKGSSGRRGRRALLACLAVAGLAVAGCGAEDHPNDPRPPVPFEASAKVGDNRVVVSPREFGAGLAVFTISNQTSDFVQLVLEGPTDAVSDQIEPGGVIDSFKVPMEEGFYEVSVGDESDVRPAELFIGSERPSSSNELLLP